MNISDPNIVLQKPLVTLESRLREIPTEWRRDIEPKIERRYSGRCWHWVGAHDWYGRPVLPDPDTGKTILARRYVAKIFYQFPDTYFANCTCGTVNCVNPAHIEISHLAGHREKAETA